MSQSDEIKRGIQSIIRATFPNMDFLASYPCKILAQHANGSLDLQPDDTTIPGHQNVPIRYGIPGISAKVAVGGRVHLEFANGDPSHPVATIWEAATVTELDVDATLIKLNGGSAAVGRVGDAVSPTAAMSAWITAVSTFCSQTPPVSFGTITAGASGVKA